MFRKLVFILVGMIVLIGFLYFIGADSEGPNSPGTVVDDDTVGTLVWSNPSNAGASDDSYATQGKQVGLVYSHYLKATNFSFNIPASSIIDGILIEIERKGSFNQNKDVNVKIVKSDGTIGSENKADTETYWSTTEGYYSYGNSTDLWGESWTAEDINDVDFGVALSTSTLGCGPPGCGAHSVDHIRITVYYTEAPEVPKTISLKNKLSLSGNGRISLNG